jgi:hypothetical protein
MFMLYLNKQVKDVTELWKADLSKDAKKQYIKLKRSGTTESPPL